MVQNGQKGPVFGSKWPKSYKKTFFFSGKIPIFYFLGFFFKIGQKYIFGPKSDPRTQFFEKWPPEMKILLGFFGHLTHLAQKVQNSTKNFGKVR